MLKRKDPPSVQIAKGKKKGKGLDDWITRSKNATTAQAPSSITDSNKSDDAATSESLDKQSDLGCCASENVMPPHVDTTPDLDELTTASKGSTVESNEGTDSDSTAAVKDPRYDIESDCLSETPNHSKHVEPQKSKGRDYKFQQKWYDSYPWLHYDEKLKKVFCFDCLQARSKRLFSESLKAHPTFTKSGYGNWKNGNEAFKQHQISAAHKEAVEKLLSYNESPIGKQLSSTINAKQEEARIALKAIFTSIIFLAKQGMALRGSDSTSGNFMALLGLRANDISQLNHFLLRPKSYTSGSIQNEILEIVSHAILRKINKVIHEAKFYSIIVDETSDCSVREQVSLSVRIVNDTFDVEEYFLGLYETPSTSGITLTTIILDTLSRFNLSIEDIRGQCFDGASNMSGQFNGVQARILALQKKALFVHCLNHSLNLALQDTVTRSPFFRDLLSYVNELGVIVNGSPKRKSKFEELLGNEDLHFLKPRPLCPTRWTVREKSIIGVINSYETLMILLEGLANSSDKVSTKAAGLYAQMEKGDFYLGLLMARNMFHISENLSRTLQNPSSTVAGGIEAATLAVCRLAGLRASDKFEELWTDMMDKVEKYSLIRPSLPRPRRKTQKSETTTNNDEPFANPKERLKDIYIKSTTLMCEEIGRRFDQPGLRTYEKLENVLLKSPVDSADDLREVCNFYEWDPDKLSSEISVLRNWDKKSNKWNSSLDVCASFKSLAPESRGLLSTLSVYLKHILVIPCSSAGAERSFSRLRRIKNYLRSTMEQDRLNHCCVLNCYADIVDEISTDDLLNTFIKERGREVTFGKFG